MSRVPLKGVRARRRCTKPNCSTGSYTLHRHHIKHEAMWLGVWAGRRRGEAEWEAFKKRYEEFRPEDVVDLCDSHHAEIHTEYDKIIAKDIAEVGRSLSMYSWEQAKKLMAKLQKYYHEWSHKTTPGRSSKNYDKVKAKRRELLKKKARGEN